MACGVCCAVGVFLKNHTQPQVPASAKTPCRKGMSPEPTNHAATDTPLVCYSYTVRAQAARHGHSEAEDGHNRPHTGTATGFVNSARIVTSPAADDALTVK